MSNLEYSQDRRRFLFISARFISIVAVGAEIPLLLSGCTKQEQPKPLPQATPIKPTPVPLKPRYQGPIEGLRGFPLIDQFELDSILLSLENTKQPLLAKVARDIRVLRGPDAASQLPPWVGKETFPFAITIDRSSTHSVASSSTKIDNSPEAEFLVSDGRETYSRKARIKEIYLGTKLAIYPGTEDNSLFKALLLAKEHLSHLTTIAIMEDFGTALKGNPNIKISHKDGSPITDPQEQKIIERTLFVENAADKTNPFWKIMDGFPMLLLVPTLEDLDKVNQLPVDFQALSPFVMARKIVSEANPELMAELKSFGGSWVSSDQLTFGEKGFSRIVTASTLPAVLELNKRAYGN